jgi:plasmid stabilization system protein ParE
MAARYRFGDGVEAEIYDAAGWYAQEGGLELGLDFLEAVDGSIAAICERPHRFPAVWRDVRQALLRRFPYKILFCLDGDLIVVLAVLHDKRHPRSWRHRR